MDCVAPPSTIYSKGEGSDAIHQCLGAAACGALFRLTCAPPMTSPHSVDRCSEDSARTVAFLYTSIVITVISTTIAVSTKFFTILDLHLRLDGGGWDAAYVAVYFLADAVSRSVAVAMFYGSKGGGALMGLAGAVCVVDLAWQALAQGDLDYVSFPASVLSVFTALPLSCKTRDRMRLFVISIVATVLMVVWSMFAGYDIEEGGNSTATPADYRTANVANMANATADGGSKYFNDTRVWPGIIVAVSFLVVKMFAYLYRLDRMVGGEGKIGTTGLGLFALSDSSHQQFQSFNKEDWRKYFSTEASQTLKTGIGRENSSEHKELQKAIKHSNDALLTMIYGLQDCNRALSLLNESDRLEKQSNLKELCLRDCNCNIKNSWHETGNFGTLMTWLKTESILVELNLRGCKITSIRTSTTTVTTAATRTVGGANSMVDDIVEMLSANKHLRSLDLSYNSGIGDAGFASIISMLRERKNTTLDTFKVKRCCLGIASGLKLIGYLEWKVKARGDEIAAMAEKHAKLDYWKLKELQTWGLQTIDLKDQFERDPPPPDLAIRAVKREIESAAAKFVTTLPTKKKDVVLVAV